MLRFLLATYGTRGDVHPMLALGQALSRRGHQVVLACPADFADDAARAGVVFRRLGGRIAGHLARNGMAMQGDTIAVARAIKRAAPAEIGAQFELLTALAREADRVVSGGLVFAARSCAEHAGVPHRFIALAPELFPSRYHPPLGVRRQDLPVPLNRIAWWAARRLGNWLLRVKINQGRAKLGLPPVHDALAHFADPLQSLLATDAELAPAPPDVRLPDPPTGAMLLDMSGPLPGEVDTFLAAGAPPVYVGFGSMPEVQPADTRALVVEAVRRAGCRALIYAGDGVDVGQRLGPDILIVGTLPHATLFPRVALVVHHGGAGTCARAARAGIPQVTVPHLLDQFPYAARLARRRLAPPPIFRKDLAREPLARRIREALHDPVMRGTAARVGRDLAGRNGAEQVATLLSRPQ